MYKYCIRLFTILIREYTRPENMTPARAPHGDVCTSSRRTTRSNFLQSGSQVGIMCLSIMAEFWESARRGFCVTTFSPYFKSGLGEP